ncbi:hypothetical protein H5410_046429 [Solanum commersonii]|uniref:DUF4283 domain-containing protein n=1 Tax=Solanum commersonii TaxID=4109 RepID=A0A9J5XC84_SOLCO|nr:hypothetical protein H5410_046429 [Solanum commersonii]
MYTTGEPDVGEPWPGLMLVAKGMNLSYIPCVIQEGEVVVQLTEEDRRMRYGHKKIYWKPVEFFQKAKVFLHNDGYFEPVILKSWAPNFNFKEGVLHIIPLWVKLPNLPLNCWTATTLNKIGSGIGKTLCANAYTSNMEQISYARVLVETDVTQQMKERIVRLRCRTLQGGQVIKDENLHVEKRRGKKVWRQARVLDPNTNPLIDDKGRYKAQLVGEGEKRKGKFQEEQ